MNCNCDHTKRVQAGFSLIELMVALFVFSIAMTGGYACIKMGIDLVDNSRHNTRAAQIMQSEIERVRSMAWADLTALSSSPTSVVISSDFSQAGYTAYSMTRAVTGSGSSRKITLVIAWDAIGGRTYSKTYVTQYTQGGIYDYIQ